MEGLHKSSSRQITSVVFSRDGKTIVSGSFDKSVKIWDMETGDVAEETQDLAVNVDETAMLRAEIERKDEALERQKGEIERKDEESAAMHARQTMEIANLKQTLQKEKIEKEAIMRIERRRRNQNYKNTDMTTKNMHNI